MSRLFLALGFCTIFLLPFHQTALGDECSKPFIVLEVNFRVTRLSAQGQAEAKTGLIGACLEESQLGQMAEAVRGVLKEAGNLRATVLTPLMTLVEEGRIPQPVSLTFKTVEEGRRYQTHQIEWWYVNSFAPEQIRSVSTLRVGDILVPGKLRGTVENVKNMYCANG